MLQKCFSILSRGFLFLISHFRKTPLILATPFFSNFVHTPIASILQPPPPLLFLLSCFFGWMGDRPTFDVLLHMLSLDTLVPVGPCCLFYATRHQVYRGLTHNIVFWWYSDLLSHTQTHTNTRNTLRGQWTNTPV